MPDTTFDDAMPFAPLKIISIGNYNELGMKIDSLITARRKNALLNSKKPVFKMPGYDADSYLVPFECPRFGTGELLIQRITATLMQCVVIIHICHLMIILWILNVLLWHAAGIQGVLL